MESHLALALTFSLSAVCLSATIGPAAASQDVVNHAQARLAHERALEAALSSTGERERTSEVLVEAPGASPSLGLGVDHSRLHWAANGDVQWVRGKTYKARVAAEGFGYWPFLGSEVPRSYPASFRLKRATLDGEELGLDRLANVTVQDERAVLDRGPIDVRYDFGLESVEQSFLVDVDQPQGELVLEVALETDLDVRSDGPGLSMTCEHGGIEMSGAFVVDGAGRREEVPLERIGNVLTLRVPAAFIDSAVAPIVVDPIVRTFQVDGASGNQYHVDCAYDMTNDTFLYAYTDTFSGTDDDVYCTAVNTLGAAQGSFYFDMSSKDVHHPSVANLNHADQFMIVAQKEHGSMLVDVVGRAVDAATLTAGPETLFSSAPGASAWNVLPCVSGDSTTSTNGAYQLTWVGVLTQGEVIFARRIFSFGSFTPVQVTHQSPPGDIIFQLAISESAGHPSQAGLRSIVFGTRDIFNGEGVRVRAYQLGINGSPLSPPNLIHWVPLGQVVISNLAVSDALLVDGLSVPTYAIAMQHRLNTTGAVKMRVRLCRGNNAVSGIDFDLSRAEHAVDYLARSGCALATTQDSFIVAYTELGASGGRQLLVTTFDVTEEDFGAISERRTPVGGLDAAANTVCMASQFSGGNYNSLLTGLGWSSGTSLQYNAEGAIHEESLPLSQAFQYCYGEPNLTGDRGFLACYGTRDTTSIKTLRASALPPDTLGYFLNGTGMSEIFNPGSSHGVLCLGGGSIGRYALHVASSGPEGVVSFDIDPTALVTLNGTTSAMAGQIWNFQFWHRDIHQGLTSSNFTNAVTMFFN